MDGMHSAMESIELRGMFNYALRLVLVVHDPGSTNSSRMINIALLLTAFLCLWGFGLTLWRKYSQPNVVRLFSSTEETSSAFARGGMATCRNLHTDEFVYKGEIVRGGRIFMKWDCPKGEFIQKEHTRVAKPKGSGKISPAFYSLSNFRDKCKCSLLRSHSREMEVFVGLHGEYPRLSTVGQHVWENLESLGMEFPSHCSTQNFCLNFTRFPVSVPENLAKASLQSPGRDLVKLISLREKDVSMDMALLGIDIKEHTIRLWDVQAGKFVRDILLDERTIVVSGGFVENNLQSDLVSGIVSEEDRWSLCVWDLRSSVKPLRFLLGEELAFHDVEFDDKSICGSNVFKERVFDLRMGRMGSALLVDVKQLPMRSWRIKDETALPIVSTWNSQDSVFYGRTFSTRKIVV